ncbi:MAG: TIR domain-containing protein [Pseudonocardia sp.]|uniref:TIR domain-containing protein n=1 Tax=Pseudonocardia sp. TaxID=60912 RepID=UPI001ACD21EC|nr:TIR domain-containing protein [Pseudonocardia sp.]MBN9109619.1 TIR domain-containing protein [Pseudonocardia sp.]
MSGATGFWSYVHADDTTEGGRITRIAEDLAAQYEMITTEPISIFVDRSNIEWGQEWRAVIDSALASIAFFMPVLTPRYFKSRECRREFTEFALRATQLGVRELVMPILYIDSPLLSADEPDDELVALAKSFQWEVWTSRRFDSPESTEYRTAIARMAERLAKATAQAETVEVIVPPDEATVDADDSPGFIDRVVRAEQAMTEWAATLTSLQEPIVAVGEVTKAAGERVTEADRRGAGMAGRLEVFRQLSEDLSPHADSIQELGNSFASQMNDVDSGIQAIFDQAAEELRDESNPQLPEQLATFVDQLRTLAGAANEGLGALQGMVDAIAGVENQSRSLRPVLRKLRLGLTVLIDGRDVMNSWVARGEELLGDVAA